MITSQKKTPEAKQKYSLYRNNLTSLLRSRKEEYVQNKVIVDWHLKI